MATKVSRFGIACGSVLAMLLLSTASIASAPAGAAVSLQRLGSIWLNAAEPSADGSVVLFQSGDKLTPEAPADGGAYSYIWDRASNTYEYITLAVYNGFTVSMSADGKTMAWARPFIGSNEDGGQIRDRRTGLTTTFAPRSNQLQPEVKVSAVGNHVSYMTSPSGGALPPGVDQFRYGGQINLYIYQRSDNTYREAYVRDSNGSRAAVKPVRNFAISDDGIHVVTLLQSDANLSVHGLAVPSAFASGQTVFGVLDAVTGEVETPPGISPGDVINALSSADASKIVFSTRTKGWQLWDREAQAVTQPFKFEDGTAVPAGGGPMSFPSGGQYAFYWAARDGVGAFYRLDLSTGALAVTNNPRPDVFLPFSEEVRTTASNDGSLLTAEGSEVGGASAWAVMGAFNTDTNPPSVTPSFDREAVAGWYSAPVTISWIVDDPNASIPSPITVLTQGADQVVVSDPSCDQSGNCASGRTAVSIDSVAPQITSVTTPAMTANSWFAVKPSVSFHCSDDISGIAVCPASVVIDEGINQSVTAIAVDRAGNAATASVGGLNVDLTSPTILWNGGPAPDAAYQFGGVPSGSTCSASDALSGPLACSVDGYSTALGPHTLTATATDNAGNRTVETRTYSVTAWSLAGFYQPTDNGNVYNTIKSGSTVPLKWKVYAGATELTGTDAVDSVTAGAIACGTYPEDAVEEVIATSGGTVLRYDSSAGQFVYNWKTPPNSAGKCFRVTVRTVDGSSLAAFFKLK